MRRVTAIGSSEKAPILLTLLGEDGETETCLLTKSDYEKLGAPAVGEELDPAGEETLAALCEGHRAVFAALRILAFGDNNRRTLLQKLRQRGFSGEAAEEAVSRMVARGYIREQEQAERMAARLAGEKLYGPRRVMAELCAHGFERETAEAALSALRARGEIDFAESRVRLLRKKNPPDAAHAKALLYRYGY